MGRTRGYSHNTRARARAFARIVIGFGVLVCVVAGQQLVELATRLGDEEDEHDG